ncbi:MAG: pyruvate kinase [Methylotenera sp.]|nr:MAG: pyruvate kinase [Methylotenera sp.]PPD54243.1 MAG: pyruvate kinase [Methylotenera sp.]
MKNNDQCVLKHESLDEKTASYAVLLDELAALRDNLVKFEYGFSDNLKKVNSQHQAGAINLIHYLGLRRKDVRPLQERLATAGLSSLGCAESHVLPNLQAIITLLQHALQLTSKDGIASGTANAPSGPSLLQSNAKNLLGKLPAQRQVRIMVTLPSEAADDYTLIKEMLLKGMDCARINCAHDDAVVWLRIIDQIKHACRETGRRCRILMDLAGPKLRTGDIALGPPVLKWQPKRDVHGRIITPARIWLHHEKDHLSCPASADACLPVQGDLLSHAKKHDQIEFTDARGARRKLQLAEKVGDGFWAESSQTAYLTSGMKLHLSRMLKSKKSNHTGNTGTVGTLPQEPETIRLHNGDKLIVTKSPIQGIPEQYDESGNLLRAASIACSLPEVIAMVKSGERILFDDGRIGGIIRSVNTNELMVEITQARDGGEKLLSDKGINLPDSQLDLSGLTDTDIENLEFVTKHADIVGLSFAHRATDVELLQQHLKRLNADQLGIVLKVETRTAFENLPELLFTLLRSPNVGVMIARGDLAVECGYERLAELQEEILWLTEAAHLPLIWATQVLESMAKNGKPSRAEITDAAMGERAECVMLNKGPHILDAIQMLDDILQRMQGHQNKKSALLRRLHW